MGLAAQRTTAAPPEYSRMSDSEFRDTVKKEHGYTPL